MRISKQTLDCVAIFGTNCVDPVFALVCTTLQERSLFLWSINHWNDSLMQHLFMFVTQAEGGAPGYLSGLGDDAATNLAETLAQFVSSLGIDLEPGVSQRAGELSALVNRDRLAHKHALRSAIKICPAVLLLAGASTRSTKTIQPFVEQLALPVVVDARLDISAAEYREKPALEGHLGAVLSNVINSNEPGADAEDGMQSVQLPKLVIVQTSLSALRHWLPEITDVDRSRMLVSGLEEVSESDRVPALFAAGFTGSAQGQWIIESPDF
jgi:hypothetical protein